MRLQDFRYYIPATVIEPQRLKLIIPPFSFSLPIWPGVSELLGAMPFGNDYYFSIKVPIVPFGAGFVLAVRWEDGNIERRMKLWEDVGEVLFYPVYNGERIGLNAAIEIWTVNSTDAPVNSSNVILKSSILAFPQGACCACCFQPDASQALQVIEVDPCAPYSYCSPFCSPNI